MKSNFRTWNWCRILTVAGLVLAAGLMAGATRGDLGLDEVVSLQKALTAQSWLELITQNQNDNNHLLNTFLLRGLGSQSELFVYRIPAFGFGLATMAVLAATARRRGAIEAVWVVWLAGLSFPMILYFSEARGYAPAMFFAVAALALLQSRPASPRRVLAVRAGFWVVLGLGFLSHFSFVIVAGALGGWTLVRERLRGASRREAVRRTAGDFLVPLIFLAGLYLAYVRHMTFLGGHVFGRGEVIATTAAQAMGLADQPGWRGLAVAAVALIIVAGVGSVYRRREDEWIFFGLVLLVMPALEVLLLNPQYLYFRYFMVCFPFFYLLLAFLLADAFRAAGDLRWLPVLLTVVITAGQLAKDVNLLRLGRGHYRQALQDMAAANPGSRLLVGSDHDFRNGTLLDFYGRYLPPGKKIIYLHYPEYAQTRPDWIIVHSFDPAMTPYPDVEVDGMGRYNLFGSYPFCGLSGLSWFVYQRTNAPVAVTRGK